MVATCGILAGETEIIGERCADGGVCHHMCENDCFRKSCCVPLGASGLADNWVDSVEEAEIQELRNRAIKHGYVLVRACGR